MRHITHGTHTCRITLAPSAAATNSSLSSALPLWSLATVMLAKVQVQAPHSCRRARRNCWSQTVCVPWAPVTVTSLLCLCVWHTGTKGEGTSQQVDSAEPCHAAMRPRREGRWQRPVRLPVPCCPATGGVLEGVVSPPTPFTGRSRIAPVKAELRRQTFQLCCNV